MKILDFISVKLTIGLVLGILLGYLFDIIPTLAWVFTGITGGILGLIFFFDSSRTRIGYGICSFLSTVGLGMLAIALAQPKNNSSHYSHMPAPTNTIWELEVSEVLKSTNYSHRCIARVKSVNHHTSGGKILASVQIENNTIFSVDDRLLFWGDLQPIQSPSNPHQFAYDSYMSKLGVYDQIKLLPVNYIKKGPTSRSIFGKAASLRTAILSKLSATALGQQELGLVQAILLGQRTDLDTALYNDYKDAGAVHILAVSGLHIGILLLILKFLFRPLELLKHGKTYAMIIIVLLLWAYAFITGLSASVLRAVTMFSFVTYGLYLNRPSNIYNILALSMFAILLVKPLFLFQVGFQMSYSAVFAIVWIYPLLQKLWSPKSWFLKKGWQLLSVSIAAQVGVLPLSLYYFHQFPGLFFVTNLVVVPFLGIILGAGLLIIILSLLNSLPNLLAVYYNSLIKTMNTVIHWVAQQDDFIFKDISMDWIGMILLYVLLFYAVSSASKPGFKPVSMLLLSILLLQLWTFGQIYLTNQKEQFAVLQQTANTVLLHQKGHNLIVMTRDTIRSKYLVATYRIGEQIKYHQFRDIAPGYRRGENYWFVMDRLGIYPPANNSSPVLLVTQSPKINMERLLDSMKPKQVIVDGSNYLSYIQRWKKTCLQKGIPFYATVEKGAYLLKSEY
ncbi:MAG: ComEC family competence protein [Eudoraea sp.]|nr:ComEC family competence protein [Eudoraea sp.]